MVFHVSTAEGAAVIRRARGQGLKVFAETCPQYLFLTKDDLDKPGLDGGKWMFSPRARDKSEYLMRPDLGRQLDDAARDAVVRQCPAGADLQVLIGDGLSAAAVLAQAPRLLPLLAEGAARRGWSFGRPFLVRYCRVGVLNDVGELLDPGPIHRWRFT